MMDSVSSLHCLFGYDNKLGGAVHAALNVCKYLSQGDQPVETVAPYGVMDDIGYLADSYAEVNCHLVARSFPSRYHNSRELGAWLQANLSRFQVVEIHSVWTLAALHTARACQRLGIPYFVRPHGSLDPFDLQKHAWLKRCLGPIYIRWLLRHAAGVICTVELEVERLETYGARPRCHAMPLPVPLSDHDGDGRKFRLQHDIPDDALVILFMSRVDYKKGLDFLIPALGRLRKEFPKLWFVLAGTGTPDYTQKVKEWIRNHRLEDVTREVGFVTGPEKLDCLAAADIFALPSLNENFGIVNIEAMHAGLPLLISDEVYIRREIEAGGAGLICRPAVDSVEQSLRPLMDGSIDRGQMGARGRALVQQRYRPEAATQALVDLYSQILAPAANR